MYVSILFIYSLLVSINLVFSWQIRVIQLPAKQLDPNADVVLFGPKEEKINLIFPGTKWCGSGNIAGDYNDLGSIEETDKCCREHDICSEIIEAGHTAYGLTNKGFYTKLHCDCDQRFLDCLKKDGSKDSVIIGIIYFDTLNTQCFKKEHPVVKCASYYPMTNRCKHYELDKKASKAYQFFDVPLF